MKYLNQANIQRLQVIPRLVKLIEEQVEAGGFKSIEAPLRTIVRPAERAASFGAMMAVSEPLDLFICKAANFIADNSLQGRATVHALVNAFSYQTGEPLAILDGVAITNLKCAAITGYFTHMAAPNEADTLAIIGAGVQALHQFLGVAAVRPIKRVQWYSRSPLKTQQLVDSLRDTFPKIEFVVCDSVSEAQKGAQILSTATSSKLPVVDQLDPACQHINCIGGHSTTTREVSREILLAANLLVEDRETAIKEAGVEHETALDLRSDPALFNQDLKTALTLFSSTGHSSLDLLTSWHVLEQSKAME